MSDTEWDFLKTVAVCVVIVLVAVIVMKVFVE